MSAVLRRMRRHPRLLLLLAVTILALVALSGAGDYILARDFHREFQYPLEDSFVRAGVKALRRQQTPPHEPINRYPYSFLTHPNRCKTNGNLHMLILVKSAMDHFEHRSAIRDSYGRSDTVPGKNVETVFFLGVKESPQSDTQKLIDEEVAKYNDIVQMDFVDAYFNNTIKTMMSFRWAYEHCSEASYYFFLDDDMYASPSRALMWAETATQNDQLLGGFVFRSRPLRLRNNKWRVSLEEYPWDRWPPYVTAGAYIVSKDSLSSLHLGSLFVQHFRFDDVYLGIVAMKVGLEPVHCPHIYYYNKPYSREGYDKVIAAHGFSADRNSAKDLAQAYREQHETAPSSEFNDL